MARQRGQVEAEDGEAMSRRLRILLELTTEDGREVFVSPHTSAASALPTTGHPSNSRRVRRYS